MASVKFFLPVVPPFRLDFTVWALRRRMTNIVDGWDGRQYLRILMINNTPVKITIDSTDIKDEPGLMVTLQQEEVITDQLIKEIRLRISKMLGLCIDLNPFYMLASRNDYLKSLVQQYLGVKPPRFPSIFEALINSIACQQVTLDVGIILINRLAENFGVGFAEGGLFIHALPGPEDLLDVSEMDLRNLGFSYQKVRAIKELAVSFIGNNPDLTGLEERTNKEIVEVLSSLRGVGRWSAEYALLRGFGRVNVFPGDDIGAKNNLQRLFHLEVRPDYEETKDLTSQWHPYEGLVYFHLLLDKLHAKGIL